MIKLKKVTAVALSICLFSISLYGCKSWSKTAKGGAAGAGAGGLAGAIIGKVAGNTAKGAIIGAAVGGAAGAAVGHYMDRQAKELDKELKNAKVERVGQGIKITFDSGILFDFDSSALREKSKEDIANLADVLKKYDDTRILFAGYTDSKGSNSYNQKLSERRAKSVAEYTSFNDVSSNRFNIVGYGENNPVATNDTDAGRQKNRRVEIAIYANDELKKAAKNGKIGNGS